MARMIDAVDDAVRLLSTRGQSRRRVLLIIGESRDRGSETKLTEVVTRAQQANVQAYPVTFSAYATAFSAKPGRYRTDPTQAGVNLVAIFSEIARLGKENAAEAFAKFTGGERFSFTRQRGLDDAITRIGEDLHSQYLISFTPGGAGPDEYHAIEVRVKGRPELRVRTRPGYWLVR
jgi:VWFA-related protein